jgi:hypothetical protein
VSLRPSSLFGAAGTRPQLEFVTSGMGVLSMETAVPGIEVVILRQDHEQVGGEPPVVYKAPMMNWKIRFSHVFSLSKLKIKS